MDVIDGKPHSYLGDGVYAIHDGFGVWLRANDHREHLCSDRIYLEPQVQTALNNFVKRAIDFYHNQEAISKKKEDSL